MKGKLLYIINDYSFLISHRAYLVQKAIGEKWDVTVVAPEKTSFPFQSDLPVKRTLWNLSRKSMNPFREFMSFLNLYFILKKEKPDVVHAITIKPVIYAGILRRILGFKMVASITGLGFSHISKNPALLSFRPILNLLYRLALHSNQVAVIFQNQSDQKFFSSSGRIQPSQSHLIPGVGVEILPQYSKLTHAPQEIIFGLPARLLLSKGIREFYMAATELKPKFPQARFALIGSLDDGNPDGISAEMLKNWTQGSALEWWGFQHDMRSMYEKIGVVVLPSYREGFSKVLMEAAAAGKPIITTDVPGCREAVEHTKNGLLVKVRDIDDLRNAMAKVLTQPDLIPGMGAASRSIAERQFDRDILTKPVLDLYATAL